ncbi:MAG: B12-binding domain-containing radical SAM protein [Desulfosudaceae bacterium]
MKKTALIFPRFRYPSGELPTGLATMAAYIREEIADIDIIVIDTSFTSSWQHVEAALARFQPDVTGIFMDVLLTTNALKAARLARNHGSLVIAGGPHATMAAADVIREDCLDAVCAGEGEITFKEYLEAFYGDKNFDGIPGLWYKEDGLIRRNPPRPLIADIDSLPSPAFDLFDIKGYMDNFFQLDSCRPDARGISLTVSRGCPYECTFCQPTVRKTLGRKVRIRTPERVIADIRYLQKTYGLNAFFFADDLIAVVPGWLEKFSRELLARKINIAWACNTRADTLDYATMKQMKAAGLVKIKIGIESVTGRIRNGIYHKKISRNDITRLIDQANQLGVQVFGFFMLGAPTETTGEVWRTIRFAARSGLTEALFSITTPFPGSALFDGLVAEGWTPPARLDDYDPNRVKRPPMSKHEISPARLFLLKKIAYFYFYLHPVRLRATLKLTRGHRGLRKLWLKLKRI